MYKSSNENTISDTRSSDDVLANLFDEDFQAASLSQKEATKSTENSKETLQELTSDDISSVIPTFSGLISNPSQMDDDFIDLDPPTPASGSRNLIKIANIRQETNQLTNFGVKTVTNIDMDCYWGDDQIYVYLNVFTETLATQFQGALRVSAPICLKPLTLNEHI